MGTIQNPLAFVKPRLTRQPPRPLRPPIRRRHVGVLARAARRDVEAALDTTGWLWNPGLSRWLELLVAIEEGDSS